MNVVIPNCHNYVIIIMSVFHYSLHIAYFSVKFFGGHNEDVVSFGRTRVPGAP